MVNRISSADVLCSYGFCHDAGTDYFGEQLDMFMDPIAREKQMKMDEVVDTLRRRFGFYSIQRGLMYQDRLLSACDAKADHTVHPHGYFG